MSKLQHSKQFQFAVQQRVYVGVCQCVCVCLKTTLSAEKGLFSTLYQYIYKW